VSNSEQYEAIVIGAGQGGAPLACELARAGMRTVLIDGRYAAPAAAGGDRPRSKAMAVSAGIASLLSRAGEFGIELADRRLVVDMERIRRRMWEVSSVEGYSTQLRAFRTERLQVLGGYASFVDAHTILAIQGNGQASRLSAPRIFINTGTRSALPDVPGLAEARYFTAESIQSLDRLPRHLIAIGGGYVALEFAQSFRRLGSEVSLVQRGGRLLPREDGDFAEAIHGILEAEGIRILTGSEAVRVRRESSEVLVTVRQGSAERCLTGSHLLVAAGRTPNTGTLNLGAAGVQMDADGYILANERLETTSPGIWALGDVAGGPGFSNVARDDFRVLQTNLLGPGGASTSTRLVPHTVHIAPPSGQDRPSRSRPGPFIRPGGNPETVDGRHLFRQGLGGDAGFYESRSGKELRKNPRIRYARAAGRGGDGRGSGGDDGRAQV